MRKYIVFRTQQGSGNNFQYGEPQAVRYSLEEWQNISACLCLLTIIVATSEAGAIRAAKKQGKI
jgi:hypothetical protein